MDRYKLTLLRGNRNSFDDFINSVLNNYIVTKENKPTTTDITWDIFRAGIMRDFIDKGNTCFYCKETIKRSRMTLDHKQPISRGGKLKDLSNIVLCCRDCNKDKGNLTVEEYQYKRMENEMKMFIDPVHNSN